MHGWYWHYRANKRLDNPPPRWIQEPLVVRRTLAVLCFCVCSGSALLGDLLGVSRSREHDLLSVLLIYPWIFLHVFIAYRLLVGFLFVWCSCLLVVLVKLSVLAKWLKDPLMTPSWGEEIISTKPRWKRVLCVFSYVWFDYVAMCPPDPTLYIFNTPMAWYSLYVLKVPLNTKQTNKQLSSGVSLIHLFSRAFLCAYVFVWLLTMWRVVTTVLKFVQIECL